MRDFLKNNLPKKLVRYVSSKIHQRNFVLNINKDNLVKDQKRVLISYLSDPFVGKIRSTHSNTIECLQIVNVFIKLGFVVDVFHFLDERNLDLIRASDYDVVFGFGSPYLAARKSSTNAISLMYLTELHPSFSFQEEQKRIKNFEDKTGKKVTVQRSAKFFKAKEIQGDFGLIMANDFTIKTYKSIFKKNYMISPTPLLNTNFTIENSFNKKNRNQFLWFGSSGVIHKGLDLLIDVFQLNPDLELIVCGLSDNERTLFLNIPKNVKIYPSVDVQSEQFLEIIANSVFVVFPSCSEAKSTAVLTCMNHGLIPIVTKQVGIDVFDFGVFIDSIEISELSSLLCELSSFDYKTLEKMSFDCFHYTRDHYNLKNYTDNLYHILTEILKEAL